MSLRITLSFFCFFLGLAVPVLSQPLVLTVPDHHDAKGYVYHLRDAKGTMTLEEVMQATTFVPSKSLNHGFDEAIHWFTFELENKTDQDQWILEIAFAPLDNIDFYYPSSNGKGWTHKVSGDNYPISQHDVRHQHPVFKFDLPSGERHRFFLRVKTTSSVQIPAIIWHPEAFYKRSFDLQIFNGLFYGAMIIMILYQLFLFVSTRDRIALYYVFTLFAMTHVVAYFQGYSFLYTYPEFPLLNDYMAIFTGPFFLVFSTWLTRAFLQLRKNNPWVDKLLLLNMGFDVLMCILMVIFFGDISYRYHHYAILAHSLIALVAAGLGIYNRFRPALFYLLSWLTLLVATLIFSLSNLGIFGTYLHTSSSALIIACLLQMLFISFALGNRWNSMIRENHLAKEAELLRGQLEKEKLELEVRQRTEEIELKNEKLEEVNRIKDKLFSIVSHDIKGPLTSLQLALALTKSETITQDEFRELSNALDARFNQTTEFIENLLQWASIQLKGSTFEPVDLHVVDVVKQTIMLLEPETMNKSIQVHNLITPGLHAYADSQMLRSVFRNLLMNAIKFTRKGGAVTLNAIESAEEITIEVIDNGIGIPLVNQERIFSLDSITTLGTKQEKGTGLGLLLCREFVEKNGGKIWFKSEEGKGTTFSFTLIRSAKKLH